MKDELTDNERGALGSFGATTYGGVAPISFTEVPEYTTFRAEFAFDGADIILHFYPSPEKLQDVGYWLQLFPSILDPTARTFFDATAPRLTAAYTEEMDSWWLRARGYSHILDRVGFVTRFLEKLDQALDSTTST